jgi:hypothetical protein
VFHVPQALQREGAANPQRLSVAWPNCMKLITFHNSSEDPNIRRPLKTSDSGEEANRACTDGSSSA